MRWHKFISSLLHPVLMPTIGVMLYLILTDLRMVFIQKLSLLAIVIVSTYIIPVLLLLVLKSLQLIDTYHVKTIKERKFPVIFMITLFFFVGKSIFEVTQIKDVSYLFFGTSLGLIIVYLTFSLKIKTSLHLLSMGSAVGFFLVFQETQQIIILPVIIVFIILSGILASSRLVLKAHTTKEVYLGFTIGILCQLATYYILQ